MDSALHAHLIRLLVAGGLSVVVGLALVRRPFGAMTMAWGLVNMTIAGLSLRGGPPGSELRPFLAFNLGLNCGYIGVGVAMWTLGGGRGNVRGFGQAIVAQGLILLVLDGTLWFDLPALGR